MRTVDGGGNRAGWDVAHQGRGNGWRRRGRRKRNRGCMVGSGGGGGDDEGRVRPQGARGRRRRRWRRKDWVPHWWQQGTPARRGWRVGHDHPPPQVLPRPPFFALFVWRRKKNGLLCKLFFIERRSGSVSAKHGHRSDHQSLSEASSSSSSLSSSAASSHVRNWADCREIAKNKSKDLKKK